jgi:hypothetical protein
MKKKLYNYLKKILLPFRSEKAKFELKSCCIRGSIFESNNNSVSYIILFT